MDLHLKKSFVYVYTANKCSTYYTYLLCSLVVWTLDPNLYFPVLFLYYRLYITRYVHINSIHNRNCVGYAAA